MLAGAMRTELRLRKLSFQYLGVCERNNKAASTGTAGSLTSPASFTAPVELPLREILHFERACLHSGIAGDA